MSRSARGVYPPPAGATEIPGLEVRGRVVAIGSDVTGLSLGDEVCALVISGGDAEYAVARAAHCLPRPKAVSLVDAGGLPETFFTVYSKRRPAADGSRPARASRAWGSSGIGCHGDPRSPSMSARGSSPRRARPRSAGFAKIWGRCRDQLQGGGLAEEVRRSHRRTWRRRDPRYDRCELSGPEPEVAGSGRAGSC